MATKTAKPTIREWMLDSIGNFYVGQEAEFLTACKKELAAHSASVRKMYKHLVDTGAIESLKEVTEKQEEGDTLNVAEVCKTLDKPKLILSYLKKLPPSKVVKDEDLRTQFGVSRDRWKRLSHRGELENYRIRVPEGPLKGLLWGSRKAIQQIKEIMDD
jgi:hypothetical protein